MITVDIVLSDSVLRAGWSATSSIRPDSHYSFVPGDEVFICHPNIKNLKHRNKSGVVQDRFTSNNQVWVKFFDGSFGSVDPVALVPLANLSSFTF